MLCCFYAEPDELLHEVRILDNSLQHGVHCQLRIRSEGYTFMMQWSDFCIVLLEQIVDRTLNESPAVCTNMRFVAVFMLDM
jgi:hypothetical protein